MTVPLDLTEKTQRHYNWIVQVLQLHFLGEGKAIDISQQGEMLQMDFPCRKKVKLLSLTIVLEWKCLLIGSI